jgi:hypothetical protein
VCWHDGATRRTTITGVSSRDEGFQSVDQQVLEMHRALEAALRRLPYHTYMLAISRCLGLLIHMYGHDLTGESKDLVDRSLALSEAAAAGWTARPAAAALQRDWERFTGFGPGNPDSEGMDTDVDDAIEQVCYSVAWELATNHNRYETSGAIGYASTIEENRSGDGQSIPILRQFLGHAANNQRGQ